MIVAWTWATGTSESPKTLPRVARASLMAPITTNRVIAETFEVRFPDVHVDTDRRAA